MKTVKFAPIYYQCNFTSKECYCFGLMFLDTSNDKIDFAHINNYERIYTLCKKKNIETLIESINYGVEEYKNNHQRPFDLDEIIYSCIRRMLYLHFGNIKDIKVEDDFDYVTYITKLFFKFDFKKSERLKY